MSHISAHIYLKVEQKWPGEETFPSKIFITTEQSELNGEV